jgi:hypothetical protein
MDMNLIDAKNPETPSEQLALLVKTRDSKIKKAIAGNPNTPFDVLKKLAPKYPEAFISNPALPLYTLENANWPHRIQGKDYLSIVRAVMTLPDSILKQQEEIIKILCSRTDLWLMPNESIKDWSVFEHLPYLESLALNRSSIQDVRPLAYLTRLKSLHLEATAVKDLAPLKNLTKLQNLHLEQTQVEDLSVVQHFSELKTLWLKNTQVHDVSPLSNLANMETLHICQTQVADISPLKNLKNLENLCMVDAKKITNIEVVRHLHKVDQLNIRRIPVSDLSPLVGHPSITDLMIDNLPISDLSDVGQIPNLVELDLTDVPIMDLTPLYALKMKVLYVSDKTPASEIDAFEAHFPQCRVHIIKR